MATICGVTASASFTPAASAYSAGDIVSVAQEFKWAYAGFGIAVPNGSLIRITDAVIKVDATGLATSEGAYSLAMYSATPPSAQADNAAWTLASADLPAYLGTMSIGTPVDLGAALYVKTGGLSEVVDLATSSMWGELITVPGPTYTAVARQIILYGFIV